MPPPLRSDEPGWLKGSQRPFPSSASLLSPSLWGTDRSLDLGQYLTILAEAAGQSMWIELDKSPILGKELLVYMLVTVASSKEEVSSSKGKDKMALMEEEICPTTHAFNPLWWNWLL